MANSKDDDLWPWVTKWAKRIMLVCGAFSALVVAAGYMMGGVQEVHAKWEHAKLVWKMPMLVPELQRDVGVVKTILEWEFGTVVDGEYRPHPWRRSRRRPAAPREVILEPRGKAEIKE